MTDEQSASALGAPRLSERELRSLLEVGRALVSELDVEVVLRQVLDTARELTRAQYAALGIIDPSGEELERFLFVGLDEATRQRIGPLPRGRGVLGELIRNPAPLRLPDVTAHPRSYGFPSGHPPMRSFLGVPIAIRGEAFGNLYLTEKDDRAEFSETDEELVLVLAEWAAIAIDNARLYESVAARRGELERAVRGLEATAAVARAVGFETELARVLELIVKRGRAMLDARSLLVLLDEGTGRLRVTAAAGEVGGKLIGTELPGSGTLAGTVLESGAPERVADLGARAGHGLAEVAGGATSAVVVPLGFRGRARGVLIALDRVGGGVAFDPDDEHLLTSFAASAAIAIATAQSVEADRLRSSIRAAEQERKRWARELHDETLQELGAVKLLLETAHVAGSQEALAAAARRGVEQLDLTIQGLQSLITELRPAALDELGVEPAVRALLERTAITSGLEVDACIDLAHPSGRSATRLEPEVTTTIYRLVQEALTNATKHAGAERVTVEIVEEGPTVTVEVTDDGGGFERADVSRGFGLVGMEERVALVGGTLVVDSKPGRGTRVRAELPARHVEPPPASRGRIA
jgi:two-component system, NarL family, sensor histidine kinase DevS